jgi:hypothetical protein
MIGYIEIMQGYCGSNNHGFLTDEPRPIQLAEDDYIRCRYDAQSIQWRYSRPSKIKYPTAKGLIKQDRKEYAVKVGLNKRADLISAPLGKCF